MSKRLCLACFVLLLVVNGCRARSSPPRLALERIAQGFASPVALVDAGDGSGRLFIVDQTGLIWIVTGGERLEQPFLDLRSRLVELNSLYDERGLLGLTFHPRFDHNGRFYVSYSGRLQSGSSPDEWDHTTYISEFTVSAKDANQADPGSERVLFAMDKPGYNYEAGHIAFGPDGYLYIATGDSVRDPAVEAGRYAQDLSSLLGKILRVDVNRTSDTGQNYSIPPDNPFVSGEGRPEIYAYGFRNPYRFSFDVAQQATTQLFVADVGQAAMEEVSLVEKGGNYGWPVREGRTCFNPSLWSQPLQSCPSAGMIDPVIAYPHEGELSAVIGGAAYRGAALPELSGRYIFGDWGRGNGRLFVADRPRFGTGGWQISEIPLEAPLGQLLGIGQDGQGKFYLLTKAPGAGPHGDTGAVYQLIPGNGP